MEEKEKDTCECENCSCNHEDKNENSFCNHEECNCHEENEHKKSRHEEKIEKKLMKQIEELEQKAKEANDLQLRAQAELVNYRKRKDDEITKMLKYANEDLVKELLPMIDNLERAIKLDDDDLTDDVSKFLSGVKMIYCSTIATLEKFGVKAIDGANKLFDPAYHQAVMTEPREGVEPGMVIEVLQKGYLLKDKVIRPAMVKVSE